MRIRDVILNQVTEIKAGDQSVFSRKLWKLLKLSSQIILAVPFVILMRVLKPLVHIRIGKIQSVRLGHFAIEPELYLCERDAGYDCQRAFDVFFLMWKVCNHQLKEMWKRKLLVSGFAYPLHLVNRLLPGYEAHVIKRRTLDTHGLLEQVPCHLSFTYEEEERGLKELADLGVGKNCSFICFHNRDSAYLPQWLDYTRPSEYAHRDSDIRNYLLAAERLADRGYYLIRMGASVKESLNASNAKIIDYATQYRTEFLDIFLSSRCHFFITGNSGLEEVARVFRRPLVYVNYIGSEEENRHWPIFKYNSIFIAKKLWLKAEKRFLTFREILTLGAGGRRIEWDKQTQLEIVENTREEIASVSIEMEERLRGIWKTTEEDEEMQRRFRGLFNAGGSYGRIMSRIGAQFLRENRDLVLN